MLIRKIQCHDAISTSQPPSVGPTSGPIKPGSVTNVIARRNSPRGNERSTASRPTGSSIAPPMPCTTREPTSCVSVCEYAQSSEPSVNVAIAAKNTRRVPKRSASQPDAGISIAIVSA